MSLNAGYEFQDIFNQHTHSYLHAPMETSLRDRVDSLLTEYSQLTRQFFQSLTAIAENASTTTDPLQQAPDQLVKRITDVDARLQSALEESTFMAHWL